MVEKMIKNMIKNRYGREMVEKRKIGLLCFANDSGIGIQTKRLTKLINPDKIMIIDSRGFSQNKEFHPEWYSDYKTVIVDGFPKNYDIISFIKNLDYVFAVENPYNFYLIKACNDSNIKTIIQTNYEFCENLQAPWLPTPDLFLMPSYWMIEEMKERFGKDRVMYLPPPTDPDEFEEAFYENNTIKPKPRFLHIVGTLAYKDRNGTLDLLKAVKLAKEDFELVIKSQHKLPNKYIIDDPRVKYVISNVKEVSDLYYGFDAYILPRRYGGLSLTTNEALMSGLPVMMTDISPNNKLLPKDWLIPVKSKDTFLAREIIDCYYSDINAMAKKIDEWTKNLPDKNLAFEIAKKEFSPEVLKPKYNKLISDIY